MGNKVHSWMFISFVKCAIQCSEESASVQSYVFNVLCLHSSLLCFDEDVLFENIYGNSATTTVYSSN